MQPEKVKETLKVLLKVALSDGHFEAEEQAAIAQIKSRLEASPDASSSEEESRELMRNVLRVAGADGKLEASERDYIGELASSLGISETELAQLKAQVIHP